MTSHGSRHHRHMRIIAQSTGKAEMLERRAGRWHVVAVEKLVPTAQGVQVWNEARCRHGLRFCVVAVVRRLGRGEGRRLLGDFAG